MSETFKRDVVPVCDRVVTYLDSLRGGRITMNNLITVVLRGDRRTDRATVAYAIWHLHDIDVLSVNQDRVIRRSPGVPYKDGWSVPEALPPDPNHATGVAHAILFSQDIRTYLLERAGSPEIDVSHLEEKLAEYLGYAGLGPFEREYRFMAPERQYRFDFADPVRKFAIEVEGGTWVNGAHGRGKHFESDCVKYNEAAIRGWTVIRVTTDMVTDGRALQFVERALSALEEEAPLIPLVRDDLINLRNAVSRLIQETRTGTPLDDLYNRLQGAIEEAKA